MTSATGGRREIPADSADDFEWVNAWAASTSPHVKPAARELQPQGTALVQELAHIRAAERPAPKPLSEAAQFVPPAWPVPDLEPAVGEAAQSIAFEAVDATPVGDPVVAATAPEARAETVVETMAQPIESIVAVDDASGPLSAGLLPSEVNAPAADIATAMSAPAAAPEFVELVDEPAAPAEERSASAPIAFLDFARRAKRWRSLFGGADRGGASQGEAQAVNPLEALPESSDPVAADAVMLAELVPAIAPDQLDHDIAEIALRRDSLQGEWEQSRRAPLASVPRSRTTDYVPILLGCVLGFTLVVVFGAAASFVSLR